MEDKTTSHGQKPEDRRVIAVDKLPLDYEALKPYLAEGCVLWLETSPTGRGLKHPVPVNLKPGTSRQDLDLVNYVVTSLLGQASAAIPWVISSAALMRLAQSLRRYRSSSPWTLREYVLKVKRFCDWKVITPDDLVSKAVSPDGLPDPRGIKWLTDSLKDYMGDLQARNLAPNTVKGAVKAVRALLTANDVSLPKVEVPAARVVCEDRAPKPEELQRMVELADPRGRAILYFLALGGFREGTLVRLQYYHIHADLEKGVTPVHVHVEADITKGRYGSYDTFLGAEAIEALKMYLDQRRRGSPSGKIPPETIADESPLIRLSRISEVRPMRERDVHREIRILFTRAGLSTRRRHRLHTLRPHSLRKFFRTQLAALGVPPDYIDYMMGHKVSTYHDVKMKGVEFLRNVYAASGLSIKPRTQVSRVEMLKEIIRAWGLDPELILVKEALSETHKTIAAPAAREEEQVKALADSLKEMLRKEVLQP